MCEFCTEPAQWRLAGVAPFNAISHLTGVAARRRRPVPCGLFRTVEFELRRLDTGGLVHRYDTQGAALAFVRDVVRVAGHEQAGSFALYEQDSEGREQPIAEGADLVWRALQDRADL